MAKHPKIFDELYVSMVRAGEVAGNLDDVLGRLADFLESAQKLKSKVQSAMIYPMVMVFVTVGIIGVLMVLAFVPLFAAILRIPFAILTPLIVVVCAIGSYAVHNSMIDIWYMLIFGVIGYVFKKLDYPLAPLVLALVLGDLAENALRQSLIMSQGSLAIFLTRPISGVITAVAIFFFVLPALTPWWRKLRGLPQSKAASTH